MKEKNITIENIFNRISKITGKELSVKTTCLATKK